MKLRRRLGFWGALGGLVLFWGCASGPESGPGEVRGNGEPSSVAALRGADPQTIRRTLIARSSRSAEEELLLAEAYLKLGERENAANAYYAARGASGRDSATEYRALMGLGELAMQRRDAYGAVSRFEEAGRAAPGTYERDVAVVNQARAKLQIGDQTAARELRRQISRSDVPGLADLDLALGAVAEPAKAGGRAPLARVPPPEPGGGALAKRPKGKGLKPPPILDRSVWHARPIRRSGNPDPMGSIERVTVHHTADPIGPPGASLPENSARVKSYQETHQDIEHWADIGYHFVIDQMGRIYEGRELMYQGAHAGNPEANFHNVGVALIGDFDKTQPTPSQKRSLLAMVKWLCAEYSIPSSQIYGHDDIMKKTGLKKGTNCPGRYLEKYVFELRRAVAEADGSAKPSAPVTSKGRRK